MGIWPGNVCVVKRECKYEDKSFFFFFQRLAVVQRFVAAAQFLLCLRWKLTEGSFTTRQRPLHVVGEHRSGGGGR